MTEAKIDTLFDRYKDSGNIQNLSERTEALKRRAVLVGAGSSLAFLFANEVSRFTLRSPLVRLKPISSLLILLGPTAFCKYMAHNDIDLDVKKLWRIHKTREELGLGGTFRPDGNYPEMIKDQPFETKFPVQVDIRELILGTKIQRHPNHEGVRGSPDIDDYPNFWEDIDRQDFNVEYDNVERLKPFDPKEGATEHSWFAYNLEDTDAKWQWGSPEGDNMFAEPPDASIGPFIDHGVDEKFIWSFPKTSLNQDAIVNKWLTDPDEAATDSNAPGWFEKLISPAWFTNEKYIEMMEQTKSRTAFSQLQSKLAMLKLLIGNHDGFKKHSEQVIEDFITQEYHKKLARDAGEIHIKDDTDGGRKLHTTSEEEDVHFFNYVQKLKEYNSDADSQALISTEKPKRGVLEGRVNRFVDCIRKAKDITNNKLDPEEIPFSKEYLNEKITHLENLFKDAPIPTAQEEQGSPTEDEFIEQYSEAFEEVDEFFKEIGFTKDFKDLADQVSQAREEYNYTDDMRSAFQKSLSTPLADQIFDTIPDHALLDIKVPLKQPGEMTLNRFNPSKPKNAYTFFEYAANEEYFERQKKKDNRRTHVSLDRPF